MNPAQAKGIAWGLMILGAVLIVVPLRLSEGISLFPILLSLIGLGVLWVGKTMRDAIAEAEYEQDVGIRRSDG